MFNYSYPVGCGDCSSILDIANSTKSPKFDEINQSNKMDPIDENIQMEKHIEPDIQSDPDIDRIEPETIESGSLEGLSDSGIYSDG